MRRPRFAWSAVFGLLLVGGCASGVPRQAVELSMAVDERITAMQASHVAFVEEYFDAVRGRVDDFVRHQWTPAFLEKFVRDADLVTLVADPQATDADRGQVVLEFAEAAIAEIQRQRDELLAPLDRREKQVLRELKSNYTELSAMSATITAHLQVQSDVSQMQEDVLRRLRLQEERDAVLRSVEGIDAAIERVLATEESVEVIREEIAEILRGPAD